MFCIATLGLAVSCNKEEKEEISLVGKWKCIYALVENFDYIKSGQTIKIDTNIYYDEGRIGKIWEFSQDGLFTREGVQDHRYTITGNNITFIRTERPYDTTGIMMISEIHNDWMQLFSMSDTRDTSGVGTHRENTFIFSKIEEE